MGHEFKGQDPYLPPGVRECDIPGSRPEDKEVEVDVSFLLTVGEVDEVLDTEYEDDTTEGRVMLELQRELELHHSRRGPEPVETAENEGRSDGS